MAKLTSQQFLKITPESDLEFTGPFTSVVTVELKLENPLTYNVMFKVKTTAPRKYCVRPNCGLIEPGKEVVVQIMLQPFDYDPQEKNNHKFMVQSMVAPEGVTESKDQIWKDTPHEQINDTKLRCIFNNPVSNKEEVTKQKVQPDNLIYCNDNSSFRKKENVQKLNNEIENLKNENEKIADDSLRFRSNVTISSKTKFESQGTQGQSSPINDLLSKLPIPLPVIYFAVALIIGVLLGKFLF